MHREGGTLGAMARASPPRSFEPGPWGELARQVASGHLRGEAAEQVVVDAIVAGEIAPGMAPGVRTRIRGEVVAAVREDRALRALLYGPQAARLAPDVPPRPTARDEIAPPPAPAAAATAHPRARAERTRGSASPRPSPRRRRGGQPRRRAPDEALEVEAFAARQTRNRVLGAIGIVGLGAALVGAWSVLRTGPCEALARRMCLKLEGCDLPTVGRSLKEQAVTDEVCERTMQALDEALEGVDPAKSVPVFVDAMNEQLGFDPRGEAAQWDPSPSTEVSKTPTPVVVVEGQASMTSLFADGVHLIWSRQSPPGVWRVRNIGGAVELLAQHPDPIDVTATRDFVYWVGRDPAGAKLWTDKKRGEYAPATIEAEGFSPVRAAFMGPELAFIDATTGAVVVLAVAGGEPRKIAEPGLPAPVAIAADETDVFWATAGPQGGISAAPRTGGPTRQLAAKQPDPRVLRPDATHLYWLDRAAGAIFRVAKAGGSVETVTQGHPGVWDFALDDTRVFFSASEAGKILAVPKAGGDVEVVVEGLTQPRHVVIDGAAVYWEAGGVVQRLPK